MAPKTLYDKIFNNHIVATQPDGQTHLLYIDRHIVHEVTSPQAFEGLANAGRKVRRKDLTLTTADHNVPTDPRKGFKSVSTFIKEEDSRIQVETLEDNIESFNMSDQYFGLTDKRQGIVHIIGPEQAFTLPGSTLVCGDSHTSTNGAFGCLAFGIGTSEVEHVLATQTVVQKKSKNMRIQVDGKLGEGVSPKDVVLHIIGVIGTAGATGCVVEYCGTTFENMTMEGRMSVCNMSIEAGARAGLVAPDETTFEYLKGRPMAPKGEEWNKAVQWWKSLCTDPGAHFDKVVTIKAQDIEPTVSWGNSPQDVVPITGNVPYPEQAPNETRKQAILRALKYQGLEAGQKMEDVKIDKVFIGSCTNARIEDLRSAAAVALNRHVAPSVYAMVVPGSGLVKIQAEKEGLDKIFKAAGFDWREAGCSMCLGMNPDKLKPGERCASTSNRNFEGRQGPGGRTHLMSPAMAAAAAIQGHLYDVRKLPLASLPSPRAEATIEVPTNTKPSVTLQDANPNITESKPKKGASITTSTSKKASAGLPPFTVWTGIAAPLHRANVDTDLIIPARFLKTIKRTGLGTALFDPIRYDSDTRKENPDFILNREPYRKTKILVVTGENFGCGSSREHAPWALQDFGIRCIIAPSFAEIHENNLFKNGMLPISSLSREQIQILAEDAEAGKELTVDLPRQVIVRPNGEELPFQIEEFRKHCLVNGLDDIGLTLALTDKIEEYEIMREKTWPWLEGNGHNGKQIESGKENKMEW